jgi:hypothetical protein
MRLLKQMIESKLKNARILEKNNQNVFAYQEKLSAYLLALSYLQLKDKLLKKKERLWWDYIENKNKSSFKRLLKYFPKENYVIFQALNKMDKVIEEQLDNVSPLFKEFAWAIPSYEHEE